MDQIFRRRRFGGNDPRRKVALQAEAKEMAKDDFWTTFA